MLKIYLESGNVLTFEQSGTKISTAVKPDVIASKNDICIFFNSGGTRYERKVKYSDVEVDGVVYNSPQEVVVAIANLCAGFKVGGGDGAGSQGSNNIFVSPFDFDKDDTMWTLDDIPRKVIELGLNKKHTKWSCIPGFVYQWEDGSMKQWNYNYMGYIGGKQINYGFVLNESYIEVLTGTHEEEFVINIHIRTGAILYYDSRSAIWAMVLNSSELISFMYQTGILK